MFRYIGMFMVCLPFILMFTACAIKEGFVPAVVIFGLAVFTVLWIITRVVLLCH